MRRSRNPRCAAQSPPAFTLVELLVVMAVIAVLAGLVLGTSGYAQKKAARSRAEAEIKAMEAALESYKADNGEYPRNGTTDALNAASSPNATANVQAALELYRALSGDTDLDRRMNNGTKQYFEFRPEMLLPSGGTGTVTALVDPFGNSYGYSTAYVASNGTKGYNPTFDLWSTGGNASGGNQTTWITNW